MEPYPDGVHQRQAPQGTAFEYLDRPGELGRNGADVPVWVLDTLDWQVGNGERNLARRRAILDDIADETGENLALLTNAPTSVGDMNDDTLIDPVFGHHEFIEGIIRRIEPKTAIEHLPALTSFGASTDATVARILENQIDASHLENPEVTTRGFVSLSLGGYTVDDEPPIALTAVIRRLRDAGWVVVASAGNDGTCRPMFPAAQRNVIAVGAVGPTGPATFTNYGPWVNACAPGVDLISTVPDPTLQVETTGEVKLAQDAPPASALQRRPGVAAQRGSQLVQWSGTSFSAPAVVGALARVALHRRVAAAELDLDGAVDELINDPVLLRIPQLGTVVNVT